MSGMTGTLRLDSSWPEGDFRNVYFAGDKLRASVEHRQFLHRRLALHGVLPGCADLLPVWYFSSLQSKCMPDAEVEKVQNGCN